MFFFKYFGVPVTLSRRGVLWERIIRGGGPFLYRARTIHIIINNCRRYIRDVRWQWSWTFEAVVVVFWFFAPRRIRRRGRFQTSPRALSPPPPHCPSFAVRSGAASQHPRGDQYEPRPRDSQPTDTLPPPPSNLTLANRPRSEARRHTRQGPGGGGGGGEGPRRTPINIIFLFYSPPPRSTDNKILTTAVRCRRPDETVNARRGSRLFFRKKTFHSYPVDYTLLRRRRSFYDRIIFCSRALSEIAFRLYLISSPYKIYTLRATEPFQGLTFSRQRFSIYASSEIPNEIA